MKLVDYIFTNSVVVIPHVSNRGSFLSPAPPLPLAQNWSVTSYPSSGPNVILKHLTWPQIEETLLIKTTVKPRPVTGKASKIVEDNPKHKLFEFSSWNVLGCIKIPQWNFNWLKKCDFGEKKFDLFPLSNKQEWATSKYDSNMKIQPLLEDFPLTISAKDILVVEIIKMFDSWELWWKRPLCLSLLWLGDPTVLLV